MNGLSMPIAHSKNGAQFVSISCHVTRARVTSECLRCPDDLTEIQMTSWSVTDYLLYDLAPGAGRQTWLTYLPFLKASMFSWSNYVCGGNVKLKTYTGS